MPTKDEVLAENRRLKMALEQAEQSHKLHVQQVKEVALRYAREHDMCEVVYEALEEADIPVEKEQVTFEVVFKINAYSWPVTGDRKDHLEESVFKCSLDFELDEDYEHQTGPFLDYEIRKVEVIEA